MERVAVEHNATIAALDADLADVIGAIASVQADRADVEAATKATEAKIAEVRADIERVNADTSRMATEMEAAEDEAAEERQLAADRGTLEAKHARIAELEAAVDAAQRTRGLERDRSRAWCDRVDAQLAGLASVCDAQAADESRSLSGGDPSALWQSFAEFMEELTTEREASFRDLTQDLIVRLEEAEELDRAVAQVQDANKRKRDQVIAAAHDFANRLTAAFEGERERYVSSYRTAAVRNAELRHHLHRGTHNARPTQLTERERRALQKQHEVGDEVHGAKKQLDAVRSEIAELDRRAEAALRNSKESDEAFHKARQRHHEELKEGRTFIRMLEREGEQWRCAKSDLELLLKYAHAGGIPDSAAQPKWRLATIARKTSRMQSAAASVCRSGAASTLGESDVCTEADGGDDTATKDEVRSAAQEPSERSASRPSNRSPSSRPPSAPPATASGEATAATDDEAASAVDNAQDDTTPQADRSADEPPAAAESPAADSS